MVARVPWVLCCGGEGFPTKTFDRLDAARVWIDARQGKRNIYFTPAEVAKPVNKKPTKDDIARSSWLWAEIDPKTMADRPAIRQRLREFKLRPNRIVSSGGGYWGFFKLTESVSPDECERLNTALRDALGGDDVQNCDRVARLPGTVNLPNAKKRAKGQRPRLARALGKR